jgi:hypothetical protein
MEFRFVDEAENQAAPQPKTNGLQFEYIQGAPEVNLEPESSGVLRQAADLPVQFAKGTLQGTRMFTDLLGAGNPISKKIAGGEEYLDALLSAESKKDSEESARILKAAEDKGVYDQVVAGLEALSKAPLETAFNVAGMAVPNLALGALGKAAQAGKAAITATQVGLGALQGAGSIKGQIYQAVQDELRSQGMDEETIHKTASEAQAYGGKNLDQILLGAGLGAAATRAEVILSRVISGAGKQVTDDVIKNTFKNGLFEAIPEAFQGGQEQIAQNKALQNIGVDVPTMRGVVSASTMEGVAGGAFGGVAGLTESMSATPESISTRRNASPEAKAEAEIDRDSDIEAAKLSIPANDTNKILILDRVQQARQGIVNLQESLDVLEPTDPKAQGLRLDISAKQKELASLEAMAGLSVPITTIEEQQAALAGEITKPAPKPLPTDVLPTETPSATYGREEQVYDVFGGITRKPVAIPVEQVVTPPVEVAPPIAEAAPVIGGKIESTGEVLARLATSKEKKGGKANQVGYNTIEPREGFEVVYKPYGENGAGYYYSPIQEKPIKEVVSRQLTAKEQEELTWAKGTIQAADSGIASAEASRDQAKRIIDKLEPITPAPVTEQAAPAEAPAPEVAPTISESTKRTEAIAIESVNTPQKLTRRLQDALDTYGIKNRKSWTLDFENKQLVSPDKTTAIKWTTRNFPNEPESYRNQQTNLGKATLVKFQPTPAVSETITEPAEAPAPEVSEITTESLGLKYTETVSRMLGWEKTAQDFVDIYGSGGAQIVENAAAYVILRSAEQVGFTSISPSMVKRAKDIRKILRKQGYKVTDPTKPTPAVSETITEPTAASTPAAQEDVRDSRYRKFLGESAPQAISEAKNALSVFKTTMLGKRGDSPFQAEPRLRELKNSISLFVANRLNVTNQKADEIAEQIILGKPNIVDKVTELKPIKAKELDDIGAPRSSITRFGYELDDKKTYRHPREGEGKPKLGEKGGVLIPTKEDFIQAGQNIYEAGMEFGAWAKQMIQRFGDAVREFLGEVWQAVSGAPAKLNELMGYLPKKGEAGAVNVGKGKIGEKAKPAEKPAEEAKVEEKPSEEAKAEKKTPVKRGQVASIKNAGPEKKTPKQIIARTRELLRKDFFNPAEVTEQNTLTAFRALGKLVGPKKQAAAYAEELNDIGRLVDEEGVASEVSMGAILFTNDLFEYSIKLAAEGQKMMLGIMMSNMNKLPLGEGLSLEESARSMRGALERSTRFTMMGKAEQDAFANYVAEFIYGPNPTKEQIQSIKDAYAAVEKTPQVTEQELTDELESVGGRTGTDLVGKINEEFTKATEKGKEKRKTEEAELDEEYSKVQKQADAEIEKLAKIQSDTPSFDPAAARQTANDVRAIVATDLKQRPDMGRKAPWKSMLVAKLQEAGVELTAAETLADIVWRQHEINSLSRELSSINKAIEKGPISEIVKAIKETPLEDQQNPNWRYEVMRDYLRKAGLNVAQSERIAKLMDISLQKRFTMAQEQAFTDAISKTAPWKTGDTRSRRAFQKVLQALRAGALDPARNVLSDMAALNGWTGFTPEQYKALLKYDAILANPETTKADLAEAHKAIQNIISKAKLPIRARDVIGQYYDAQALSGITTMTVNIFSPAGVAVKNALVQSLNGLVTARPEQITAAMTTFVDSIKSWANTVAYSFKNNVTVYSNVEYLVNDEGLLKLYNRGVDQFNNGKTPRERADGVKNMMIGMMDYVRRVLNALDYGAIASLQNQAVSKYALAVMQAKGMSSKDGTKMLNAMMEQKRIFYNDQIAIGTDKNKAAVLADEFFISAWRQALTDAKLPAQEVIDAALNDAMSAVGRNRQSLDAFLEEETNIRDEGLLSFPAIWLLETMANAANKQDNQFIKIFSRIIYGFAIVPARVLREAVWFSPLAAHRFAYEYIAEKKGLKSRYAQSLGNDLQYRQRLTETIAGSIVMLAFGAAMSASTEDEEDKKPFKIVVTGNGPLRSEDPQYYDSWVKKNRANTVSVYFGKTKFTLNTMRGFEAFAWPAMMLGAVDDWHIRRKQGRTTNTPLQMQDGAIVAGNVLSASLRRGPYAFAAKPLFEAYGDRGVESLAKSLAFPAKTIIPVLGSSLASNLSNFLNEPVDRRTLEGALWANVPFIGPTVAPKSLNAFGEPAMANDAADKIFKLGVPIVFDIPTDRDSVNLHELVLKQGGGPSIPTRNQLAQRLDRQPTNKEYEMFAKEYGAVLTKSMKKNYEKLFAMKPEAYTKVVERIGNRARDIAENKVRVAAKKP